MIDAARRSQIITLLVTRDDHLPQPRRGDDSSPGFVHDKRARTCPDCLANGKTMKGCETCGGSGAVTDAAAIAIPDVLPGDGGTKDPYAEDKPTPYGLDSTRHDRGYARNAEITRLEQQTRVFATAADELADANLHPEGWELARARKWKQFDYRALDVALERLRLVDADAYHAITSTYVYGRGLTRMEDAG